MEVSFDFGWKEPQRERQIIAAGACNEGAKPPDTCVSHTKKPRHENRGSLSKLITL